jgi:hypothetical protein
MADANAITPRGCVRLKRMLLSTWLPYAQYPASSHGLVVAKFEGAGFAANNMKKMKRIYTARQTSAMLAGWGRRARFVTSAQEIRAF